MDCRRCDYRGVVSCPLLSLVVSAACTPFPPRCAVASAAGKQPNLEKELGPFDMPAVLAVAPEKKLFAIHRGTLAEDSVNKFCDGMMTGRSDTAPMNSVPKVGAVSSPFLTCPVFFVLCPASFCPVFRVCPLCPVAFCPVSCFMWSGVSCLLCFLCPFPVPCILCLPCVLGPVLCLSNAVLCAFVQIVSVTPWDGQNGKVEEVEEFSLDDIMSL